jgi:hypothetical protein
MLETHLAGKITEKKQNFDKEAKVIRWRRK